MQIVNLFTEPAASALVQLSSEALLHQIVKAVTEGFELHVIDDLVDEGILQEQFGLFEGDASLAHIEESRIVELAYGRTMSTLHIVGVNLQHRLGVHTCLFGSCQILIGHLRRSLLGTMLHQHTTCKGTCRLVVEHVFIEFVAGAVRHFVGD